MKVKEVLVEGWSSAIADAEKRIKLLDKSARGRAFYEGELEGYKEILSLLKAKNMSELKKNQERADRYSRGGSGFEDGFAAAYFETLVTLGVLKRG